MDKKCQHKIGILDEVNRITIGYVNEDSCPACLKEKLKRAVDACRATIDGVKGTGNSCHLSYEGYRLCSKVIEENAL